MEVRQNVFEPTIDQSVDISVSAGLQVLALELCRKLMAKDQHAPARFTVKRTMSKRVCIAVCFAVVLISTRWVCVEGLPILGPDLTSCMPVPRPGRPDAEPIDCCFVDISKPIKDFKFNLDLPMRVRRPAHKLDDGFVRKYERAVELMKALPPDDPRSFVAQSKLHCSYCANAYNQFDSSAKLSVHNSWLFFPFHRFYLYFYERILASLIGDDTFAIPYWAWDMQNDPEANIIPPLFTNKISSLYNDNRSQLHQPPYRADLRYKFYTYNRDPDVVLLENYDAMWQVMIGQVRTPEAFYGEKLSKGDNVISGQGGRFELGAHAAIHFWTGDYQNSYGEDMGPAYTAARDPIFFSHHSQIDRLWLMWKSWGGKDPDVTDWLDAEYLFYDENADLVRVRVRDTLNFSNFRVTYEQLEPDWLNHTPKSIRDINPKYAQASVWRRFWRLLVTGNTYGNVAMFLGSFFGNEMNGVGVSLGGTRRDTVTSRVSMPRVLSSTEDSLAYDEVLAISGVVEKPFNVSVLINIFLELPEADENTPRHCVEFLDDVIVDAEGLGVGMDQTVARKFRRSIGLRDTLQILGITHRKSVTVTLVPVWDPKHDPAVLVRITDLNVEKKWTGRDGLH